MAQPLPDFLCKRFRSASSLTLRLGRIPDESIYLLDTNDPANIPAHRGITIELYGGSPELRLRQDLVLGIGG